MQEQKDFERALKADAEKDLSLKERADQLRLEALKDVGAVKDQLVTAQTDVEVYKQDLIETIQVADSLGIPKDDLAKYAGVSVSTIGAWLRREDAKEKSDEPSAV